MLTKHQTGCLKIFWERKRQSFESINRNHRSIQITKFIRYRINRIGFYPSVLERSCCVCWGQCYNTFSVCNLRIFMKSRCVCPWQTVPAQARIVGEARSLPQSGATERWFTWVGSGLTCNHYTRMDRLARDKHSSLLRKFVNYGQKKFYNIGPWPQSLDIN